MTILGGVNLVIVKWMGHSGDGDVGGVILVMMII